MKIGKRFTTALVLAMTAGAGAKAAIAAPPNNPAFAGVEPRTPISALPITLTEPGSYYVTGDLVADGVGGIIVDADDVTIDLMGFGLEGTGVGEGILMNGRRNVEIRNGTVRGFENGVRDTTEVAAAQGYRMIDLRVTDHVGIGIWLTFADTLVENCIADNNGLTGILVGDGSTVVVSAASNNGQSGITAGDGSALSGNTTNGNGLSGVTGGAGSTITGNTANGNSQFGIVAGPHSTVTGNAAKGNGGDGMTVSVGSTLIGNAANDNGLNGITVDRGSTVKDNTTMGNQMVGINLVEQSLVDGNTAIDNDQGNTGFPNIESCPSCTFGLNHAP
jgi:hypothetical protein